MTAQDMGRDAPTADPSPPDPEAIRATEASAQGAVQAHLARLPVGSLWAVAVSGGGDSTALLHLALPVARQVGARLCVVSVDHGLRPEAAAEAAAVARMAAALGLRHQTLVWQGGDATGNLMAAARLARRSLISDWAKAQGVSGVLLGHTEDDLAEGFVMRLSRRAGVDGLAAMAEWQVDAHGLVWARPLLGVSRAALRAWLRAKGLSWTEDPTNGDPAYARSRARAALGVLAVLGIRSDEIAATARHLREARRALARQAADAADRCTRAEVGELIIDRAGFVRLEAETRRRLLAGALAWIAGPGYPPRSEALARLEAAALGGDHATLNGCRLEPAPEGFRIGREVQAVLGLVCSPDRAWDGRWCLHGPPPPAGSELRALGPEGLAQCPDWRASGLSRATLLTAPALFLGPDLIAAPHAGHGCDWHFALAPGRAGVHQSLLAH